MAGNHELHGGHVQDILGALLDEGQRRGIHVLDKDEVTIGAVRFLGATLWTGFKLQGASTAEVHWAMTFADESLADFNDVKYGDSARFHACHALEIHRAQVCWLKARLQLHPLTGSRQSWKMSAGEFSWALLRENPCVSEVQLEDHRSAMPDPVLQCPCDRRAEVSIARHHHLRP